MPYVTADGWKNFKDEQTTIAAALRAHNRAAASERTSRGGAPYSAEQAARDEEEQRLRHRLHRVEQILGSCSICPLPTQCDEIRLGHIVDAEDVETGRSFAFQIVGMDEGDTPASPPKYSYLASFARAFLGKGVDDEITAQGKPYRVTGIRLP
ncbi:MAG TPA: GreA/GreB family elongation factor [Candidatus Paceibacterota bacterium]|jgi:transcription elongation GreA/GreB family factor